MNDYIMKDLVYELLQTLFHSLPAASSASLTPQSGQISVLLSFRLMAVGEEYLFPKMGQMLILRISP